MRIYLLGLTLGGLLLGAACDRGPDVQVMADGALASLGVAEEVKAHYDADARIVRLSGTTSSAETRTRAVDAVTTAVGTHARIANELVVAGRDEQMADDMDGGIRQRFETLQAMTPVLQGQRVDFRVANGVVTLTGEVLTAADRTQIETLVRGIPGVRDLVSGMTVRP